MQKEYLQQIKQLFKDNNEVLDKKLDQKFKDSNEVLLKKMDEKMDEKIDGLIVGLERKSSRILNPKSETILQRGDLLMIVGER